MYGLFCPASERIRVIGFIFALKYFDDFRIPLRYRRGFILLYEGIDVVFYAIVTAMQHSCT